MDFQTHSFRYADVILQQPEFKEKFDEFIDVIKGISDNHVIQTFESANRRAKSISEAINKLLKERLAAKGWSPESPIFAVREYAEKNWRLDFAGFHVSVEVAFNHGEAIAWNLIKPVLASELNHVEKAIQTKIGIIICATDEMKQAGGFDSAVGEFEKFLRYLQPMQNLLTVPILIIGLTKPKTFRIDHRTVNGKKVGEVVHLE
jgi:hypothetical protein